MRDTSTTAQLTVIDIAIRTHHKRLRELIDQHDDRNTTVIDVYRRHIDALLEERQRLTLGKANTC